MIYALTSGGVLLALAASYYSFILTRRRNRIHEEFTALADELKWSLEQRYLVGKPTRVPTYIAPTDEVVLIDHRVRQVSLRARVLSHAQHQQDHELNF